MKAITFALFIMSLLPTSALAEKHLIFLDGYLGWTYSLPPYLAANHEQLEQLPYSGFSVVGNVFTSYVMSADPNSNRVTYERVWNEVSVLKDVYKIKTDNFLRINLDYPGDFWDDAVWNRTTENFAAVAKAAKNLGFKGILFDDEAYASGQHTKSLLMSNFKFPKVQDVNDNPDNYAAWEKRVTARDTYFDYNCSINVDGVWTDLVNSEDCSYRNNNHSFKEHMDKLALRFKGIMEAMQNEFPDITLLVLHGAATAHAKTNINGHFIKPNSVFETNEFKGAMFLGFKAGLNETAKLHDMGEFYRYQTDQHFQQAYQWRKHDIVSDAFNQDLDEESRWVVPQDQRTTWSQDVNVGFMVSDYGLAHEIAEYNTLNACQPADAVSRLTKALEYSDEYVIYYSSSALSECDRDNPVRWLDVANPVAARWLAPITSVYDPIRFTLSVSAISAQNITTTSAKIFWDVNSNATGQVEYGETTAYGLFNTKENSFDYNHHEQLLANLKQGTTYHYRVISEDAQGNRVVSDDHTFTTSGVKPATTIVPITVSLLLDEETPDAPIGELVIKPTYKDAGNIPELEGDWYGAMGEHPVRKLTMANPWTAFANNEDLKIEMFFPADVAGKKPTVFFIPGWNMKASETFHSLLYFIASQGFNAVFVPYDSSQGRNDPNILLSILDGVVTGSWSHMINSDKVGYSGHSAGASMVFYLAKERSNWGTEGRFIFPMASWWSSHLPETGSIEYPSNTNMIVQVYDDDAGTDPRQNIDFFMNNNIRDERKSYLYLPGDANHLSDHDVPYSVDENGVKVVDAADAYYFDALDQVGIYRPLESLMRYSFGTEDGLEWKAIGLPDEGDVNYSVVQVLNGISMVSTDNPLTGLDSEGNYIIPIPAEDDLDQRYLCSKADNRSTMCMPCADTPRNQAWQQCQYP